MTGECTSGFPATITERSTASTYLKARLMIIPETATARSEKSCLPKTISKTRADAIELLKDQKNLIDGLIEDQLKKDEEQQTEIERLNDTLRIMYNRCICFCGSQNCSECKQKEECESKRSFWHGYYLFHGERVKKDGEQE